MFKIILFLIYGFNLVASHPEPFFRKDYTYIPQYDAFYKVHWDSPGVSWSSAFLQCDEESSSLFYPKMAGEWIVVKDLVTAMRRRPNASEIFVGLHYTADLDAFITVNGDGILNPSPIVNANDTTSPDAFGMCVTMDIYNGTYRLQDCVSYPRVIQLFVCKKKVVDEAWFEACPTVDLDYELAKGTGKCYKIHERKMMSWSKAMETCFVEGGYLAMAKNLTEADIIKNKLGLENKDYFVGFRRMESTSDFYTVKGDKFDDTYFKLWKHNITFDTKDDCGVIYQYDGILYSMTRTCWDISPFVCEMLSKTYSYSAFNSQFSQICEEKEALMLEHNMIDIRNK